MKRLHTPSDKKLACQNLEPVDTVMVFGDNQITCSNPKKLAEIALIETWGHIGFGLINFDFYY